MTSDEPTLARMMQASQAGDALAYRQLLGALVPLLRRWFRQKVAPADLDDLVQDTVMAVHRRRASWDPARPFLPWLAAIARYRWVDGLRRASVRDHDEYVDDFAVESGESVLGARLGCDRLLALIPSGQAAAIRAVRIDGLSVAEAADRLGQSEALIKVNVHRGLKRLAALVEEG
ncbi:RNA polymerase subunit sigma-24 [Sandarakinorhabdus cyanobacteriorum]|uniref:RNA polymerase subunit sigma-24 n=1 Tax=Sandarakinorhabdus cyanobacteriorum TaxID=1981098 RepID=A0A255Y939_9SPHN|nr:sigma-70 family RNA polymerase sigma factor [Sandarakinorhabdus cyanobacteriorum]OYQ25691.1 RNA polymerase subunit sigma-24 [Sandarakinorhabdus cyanobacteriorum]